MTVLAVTWLAIEDSNALCDHLYDLVIPLTGPLVPPAPRWSGALR